MPEGFAFLRSTEYAREYSIQHVTEDKVYKEDQLPDGFGGAYITVEVIHQIFLVDSLGNMTISNFEVEEPFDKDDQVGAPKVLLLPGEEESEVEIVLDAGVGPATEKWELRRRINENYPTELEPAAKSIYEHFQLKNEEIDSLPVEV